LRKENVQNLNEFNITVDELRLLDILDEEKTKIIPGSQFHQGPEVAEIKLKKNNIDYTA
jgi:hypothetical protein